MQIDEMVIAFACLAWRDMVGWWYAVFNRQGRLQRDASYVVIGLVRSLNVSTYKWFTDVAVR